MTEKLGDDVAELVAVGAAVAANCPGCLSHHHRVAREKGASEEAIRQAIEIARSVRATPGRLLDRLVDQIVGTSFAASEPRSCCERQPDEAPGDSAADARDGIERNVGCC